MGSAIGATLFNFPSKFGTLPRILFADFKEMPTAAAVREAFETKFEVDRKDHNPAYRGVAISAMCSLVALGPEVSTPTMFLAGFSQEDLDFNAAFEKALAECHIPRSNIRKLASDIISLAETYGLDVSRYGGKPREGTKSGHLLQIFIRRSLLDELVYASEPYGMVDEDRQPISKWIGSDQAMNFGQVRIIAHPMRFLLKGCSRMYAVSADPGFDRSRPRFQEELIRLIDGVLNEPSLREAATNGITSGRRPEWWVEVQRKKQSRSSCLLQ